MNREELRAQYEDALFALLMDEIAEQEGQELLAEAERLNEDPDAAIPEELDAKCRAAMDCTLRKRRSKAAGRKTVRVLKYVLIAAALAVALFSVAYAAIEPFRVGVLNLLLTVEEHATSLTLVPESEKAPDAPSGSVLYYYGIPEIPIDYNMDAQTEIKEARFYSFQNATGELIQLTYLAGNTGTNMNIDTENAQSVTDVNVNGYKGICVEKDGTVQIAWADTDRQVFMTFYATALDTKTAMEMAQSMKYNGSLAPIVYSYNVPQAPSHYKLNFTISEPNHRFYHYTDENGYLLQFNIQQGDTGTRMSVDTENAQVVSNVIINGYEGLYVEKDEYIQVAWADTDHQVFLFVHGDNLTKDTAMELAQSMRYSATAPTNSIIYSYATPAIPNGYNVNFISEVNYDRFFSYVNQAGDIIQVDYVKGNSGTNMSIDTEGAQSVVDVKVNGYEGVCAEKDGTVQVAWVDTDRQVFMTVFATALDTDTVLEMAAAMKYATP